MGSDSFFFIQENVSSELSMEHAPYMICVTAKINI